LLLEIVSTVAQPPKEKRKTITPSLNIVSPGDF